MTHKNLENDTSVNFERGIRFLGLSKNALLVLLKNSLLTEFLLFGNI
jgi:hypothetical protein